MENNSYISSEIVGGNCPMKGDVPTLSHFFFWYIILINGTMKEIKLSQQGKHKGKYVALVDNNDFDKLDQYRWAVSNQGGICYAYRRSATKKIYMHREIMNTPKNMLCDHAFHDGLDNRKFIEINGELKANLRNCTRNNNNSNVTPHGEVKYLGVSYYNNKGHMCIRSQITVNKSTINLGACKTEEQAAKRYDMAARFFHEEFANPNFK